MNSLKDLFLLDPQIIFLNHGSFGATPRPVFLAYQEWQRRLERQPVLFLGREYSELDRQARAALAEYLCADRDDLVYVPNATYGVNIIGHSLNLRPGDEILTSNHEYGACDNTWNFICSRTGATYRRQSVPFPIQNEEEIIESIWQGVNQYTRLIFLSHITSPTALRLPIHRICQRAREAGILTLVDGAHAPGQLPLDLSTLGADFYTGNCHKWMMAPKGAAFLYARQEVQALVEPLVVSWGYSTASVNTSGSRFVDLFSWTGTHDPAAALSVPAAINFMQTYQWEDVRQTCHALLWKTLAEISDITGLAPIYPLDSDFYIQMAAAPLPKQIDPERLKARLYDGYSIEVPLTEWNRQPFIRISIQGYNTEEDASALVTALKSLIAADEIYRS